MRNHIILYGLILALLLSGCDTLFNNDSNNDQTSDLEKITSVDMWIMDADDAGQYSRAGIPRTEDKLRINADGTAEIWGARGMWQEMTYTEEDSDTLAFTTTREAYGDDVAEFKGDYSVTDNSLEIRYYGTREDGTSWEARRSFTAGSLSTPITYSEDFEDEEARFFSSSEWSIIDDGGNKVLAPTTTGDGYCDGQFQVIAGKDFVFKAQVKMILDETNDEVPDMWIGFHQDVNSNHYQEPEPTFEIRGYSQCNIDPQWDESDDDDRVHYPILEVEWDTWYDIEVRVHDGTHYQFLINDTIVDTVETDGGFVKAVKVWGTPNDREWYIDDVEIIYPKEQAFKDFDLAEQDILYCEKINGTFHIVSMKKDGSNVHSIYQNQNSMWNVVPIKGTDELLFTNNVDSNMDIYTIKRDGTDRTRLTLNANKDSMAYPTPDGSKIVFTSDRASSADVFDIFIMDADGSKKNNLTNTPDKSE